MKQVEDLEVLVDFGCSKILINGMLEYMEQVFEDMRCPFNEELSCIFTASFYVEYTAKRVDKAKAL